MISVNSTNYSSGNNLELFNFIKKVNDDKKWTPWKKTNGDRSPIEVIFFNDQLVIDAFKNDNSFKVKKESNHDNHFHIRFNIPDKYLTNSGSEDDLLDKDSIPTESGLLGIQGNIPSNIDLYLGKI